jgi:hypothetical protein
MATQLHCVPSEHNAVLLPKVKKDHINLKVSETLQQDSGG